MPAARVSVGSVQELVFRETKSKLAAYDGHHIQVYVANFSRPHKRLLERNLVTEESNQYQYRFVDITISKAASRCSRSSTRCAA